jgi:hypothetical protein
MILLTCPRCHKADEECQCWPLVSIAQIEARWGMPFSQLLEDLAEQDFSMRQAAIALGCNREALRVYVASMERSPWAPREVAAVWLRQTGETITAAARRLAETHTISQAARVLGYYNCMGLRKALKVRGVTVQFQRA